MRNLVLAFVLTFNVTASADIDEPTSEISVGSDRLLRDQSRLFFHNSNDPEGTELLDLINKIERDYRNDMLDIVGSAIPSLSVVTSEEEKASRASVIANKIVRITSGTHRLVFGLVSSDKNKRLLSASDFRQIENLLADLKATNNQLLDSGMLFVAAKDSSNGNNRLVGLDTPKRKYIRLGNFEKGVIDTVYGLPSTCMSAKNVLGSFVGSLIGTACIVVGNGITVGLYPVIIPGMLIDMSIVVANADAFEIKATEEANRLRIN